MSIKIGSVKKEFERIPAGVYPAKCYRIIDLGTHTHKTQYGIKSNREIQFSFEFPTSKTSDGKPFSLTKRMTLTFGEKANLEKFLKSWLPSNFNKELDLGFYLGQNAMISVVESESNGTVYSNIGTIMPLVAGIEMPLQTINDPIYLTLDEDFSDSLYDLLGEKLKAYIAESPEYKKLKGIPDGDAQAKSAAIASAKKDLDDEIPF